MTPAELEFRRGNDNGVPVNPDWFYSITLLDKEGKRYVANYSANHSRFEIDQLCEDGFLFDYLGGRKDRPYSGDSMLGLMCAIHELGLTPEGNQ